jgi:DNA-binding NtrC family response regulator
MTPHPKARVLIVDEDQSTSRFLSSQMLRKGLEVSAASTPDEAVRMFRVCDPALVMLDPVASGTASLELVERLKQIKPDVGIILISAQASPEFVFRASKVGADDYVGKPIDPKDLDTRVSRVLERQRLTSEVTQLRDQVRRNSDFAMLFGTSPKMEEIKNTIEQVAETNATVLIRGESGTGKEVVARMI